MTSATKIFVKNLLYFVGITACILLVWYALSLAVNKDIVAPSPWKVIAQAFALLGSGSTYLALLSTLLRAFASFACSTATALCLSLLVGVCTGARPVVDKIVTVFRALPTMSVILITLILFPSGIVPAVVAFLVAFPIIYSAFNRETDADGKLLEVCKVYGVSRRDKTRYVLLPQIKRALVPQINDTLPLCIKVVIAGEALALPRFGFGRDMYVAKVNLDTANLLAVTVLTLLVCFLIQGVVGLCKGLCNKAK